jgi:hypothetical protein
MDWTQTLQDWTQNLKEHEFTKLSQTNQQKCRSGFINRVFRVRFEVGGLDFCRSKVLGENPRENRGRERVGKSGKMSQKDSFSHLSQVPSWWVMKVFGRVHIWCRVIRYDSRLDGGCDYPDAYTKRCSLWLPFAHPLGGLFGRQPHRAKFALCGFRSVTVRTPTPGTPFLALFRCFISFSWHLINPNHLIT